METSFPPMDPFARPLGEVLAALKRMRIRHLIGGSVASGVWGLVRTTEDADIVAEIRPGMVDRLLAELGPNWYGDADSIRRLMQAGRAFNVIHMPSALKIDIFPAASEFHALQLDRAITRSIEFMGAPLECPVATAEDILLAKLLWYREGGEVSERQWYDILGILAVQKSLDDAYLNSWAERLRVTELLARARASLA